MTLREEIEAAIHSIEDDCRMLEAEIGGCRELCQKVLDWIATGQQLVERLERAETIIGTTINRGCEIQAALTERLRTERDSDDADWWKQGGE